MTTPRWPRCAALLAAALACAAFGASAAADDIPEASPRGSDSSSEARGNGLPNAAINSVVRRHARQFRLCFEVAIARRPSLAGSLRVDWVIAPSGRVESARIASSTFGDEDLEQCFVAVSYSMTFPAAPTSSRVTFPFVLGTVQRP